MMKLFFPALLLILKRSEKRNMERIGRRWNDWTQHGVVIFEPALTPNGMVARRRTRGVKPPSTGNPAIEEIG